MQVRRYTAPGIHPAMNTPTAPRRPTSITVHQHRGSLEVGFDDGASFRIPFELMRVYSPSAEVQGHGPGQEVLQTGKRDVDIDGARAGRQLRRPAALLRRPRHAASSPGTTSTSSARSRTSCGSKYEERLAQGRAPSRDAPMQRGTAAAGAVLRPPPLMPDGDERDPLRLRSGRRGDEGRARARRVRFGGAEVRPDERPDVARPAPRLEGLRRRGRQPARRATGCSTSPAAPATWRAPSPKPVGADRHGRAHRHQRGDAARRAATACSTRAWSLPTALCDAEALPFATRQLRPRQRRLRPAQHDPQGAALAEMARVLQPRRPRCSCSSSPRSRRRWRRPTTGTRSRCCRASANGSPATATATATWPSRSACTPTRTTLKAMMKTRRLRPCRRPQPERAASSRCMWGSSADGSAGGDRLPRAWRRPLSLGLGVPLLLGSTPAAAGARQPRARRRRAVARPAHGALGAARAAPAGRPRPAPRRSPPSARSC